MKSMETSMFIFPQFDQNGGCTTDGASMKQLGGLSERKNERQHLVHNFMLGREHFACTRQMVGAVANE